VPVRATDIGAHGGQCGHLIVTPARGVRSHAARLRSRPPFQRPFFASTRLVKFEYDVTAVPTRTAWEVCSGSAVVLRSTATRAWTLPERGEIVAMMVETVKGGTS